MKLMPLSLSYVKPLKEKGKREVLYDFKERLFRLWRQMRVEAGRERLSFIVTIIDLVYGRGAVGAIQENFFKVAFRPYGSKGGSKGRGD